eukprot:321828_1
MDTTAQTEQLKKELETLRNENKCLKQKSSNQQQHLQQYEELKLEHEALKQRLSHPSTQNSHSTEFWNDILSKCQTDEDYIKSLINTKQLTMTECDTDGRTLLLIAAKKGSYELVRLCLNLGADLHKTDKKGRSVLDLARGGAWTHVEQLLLFSQMNANIGNQIRNTADTINKQKGIAQNIMKELSSYDSTTKQFFQDTMMDLMINIIKKKQSFSDDLLNLCWGFECANDVNPLSTELWKAIATVCKDIIENGNKKEWFWFKKCILPSNIWFKHSNKVNRGANDDEKEAQTQDPSNNTRYLYYELLKFVEGKASVQLSELKQSLDILSNKNENEWQNLISWDIPDQSKEVRQDQVPNGIVSKFTHKELSEQGSSSASFNGIRFYDYHEYLPQLVLLAHILDDSFQKSMQNVFDIDRYTNIGKINSDGDGVVQYVRGPVKRIERAKDKAQNDYSDALYPTSAKVLDFNRCSLVFNDISALLFALQLFQNKVNYYQSGSIIGIVRGKNGFKEYIDETQYSDIKLNVLIRGKHNNIVGEVQFLLRAMKDYKAKAHNLYYIQRQKEFMETSASSILPLLLNEDKQLFVAGNKGDVNALCNLMVMNNKTEEDVMKVDDESRESILNNMFALGNYGAFKFLQSVISKKLMLDRLFTPNRYNQTPIETSICYHKFDIIRVLLSIDEVRQRYKNDINMMYRLLYCLFGCFYFDMYNEAFIDYVLKQLNISGNVVAELLGYTKYPKPTKSFADICEDSNRYVNVNIICRIARHTTAAAEALQKIAEMIGENAFVHYAITPDFYDVAALERAIQNCKFDLLKYLLSIGGIVDAYTKTDELRLLFRLLFWLFCKCDSEEMIDFALDKLNISKERIIEILSYKCTKPDDYVSDAFDYHNYNIVGRIVWFNKLKFLKKMANIIGDQVFIEHVFQPDGVNINALEFAIWKNQLEVMKYLMSFQKIKERCLTDKEVLWRTVYSMNRAYDADMVKYVMNELQLDETKLREVQSFTCEDKSNEFGPKARTIWAYKISDKAIIKILNSK